MLNGSQRHRRWCVSARLDIVQEIFEPGVIIYLVNHSHDVSPNKQFHWLKLSLDGTLSAVRADEEVAQALQYKSL
ncbi:transposase [Bartonella choladocola]|uniref:transposase n=1 Tax=Bartonella choladocola TaxID=2750995 RepID=UPI00098FBEB8|nr:transposase [Bartonella choladocola]